MWEIRFVFVQLKRCGKVLKDKIIIGDAPCIIMKGERGEDGECIIVKGERGEDGECIIMKGERGRMGSVLS